MCHSRSHSRCYPYCLMWQDRSQIYYLQPTKKPNQDKRLQSPATGLLPYYGRSKNRIGDKKGAERYNLRRPTRMRIDLSSSNAPIPLSYRPWLSPQAFGIRLRPDRVAPWGVGSVPVLDSIWFAAQRLRRLGYRVPGSIHEE